MAYPWGCARSSGFELHDNRCESEPFCHDARAPYVNYIMNRQHEHPLSNFSANFVSSLITQQSMPMSYSYGQTGLPVDNYVDSSCVNYFGRVEQANFSLNSLTTFSQPTTMQQDMPMNDLYGRSNSVWPITLGIRMLHQSLGRRLHPIAWISFGSLCC
jgi:hypothetical protein